MYPQNMKRIGIAFICIVMTGLGLVTDLRGDIALPKIFSDHMVLQRDAKVKIGGRLSRGRNFPSNL